MGPAPVPNVKLDRGNEQGKSTKTHLCVHGLCEGLFSKFLPRFIKLSQRKSYICFKGDYMIKCQLITFLKLSLCFTFFPLVAPGWVINKPNGPICLPPKLIFFVSSLWVLCLANSYQWSPGTMPSSLVLAF